MVSSITSSTSSTSSSTTATTLENTLLSEKIENISVELGSNYIKNLLHSVGDNNAKTIIDYVNAMKIEINYSDNYGKDIIGFLGRFSQFNQNKPFKDMTRNDNIIKFLDTLRKTETQDPLHKWIGTYNTFRIYLLRFFKWLYSPELEPKKRPKPSVIDNIAQLKRKEKSIYRPSDLWTQQDDLLFLKYCPSKRNKCYHAISRDLSCRPHEILKLKIRDVVFKTTGNYQYAEVLVNGKTGTRPIPLINAIPYLKDYLDQEHPQPRNPNSPLICGTGRGLGRHLKPLRIYLIYDEYKKEIFPKLLDNPNVSPEDKPRIKELLKKPWNPYIRRHSALTEKSTILKEHILRQHAGWSGSSQMHLKYLHYFGNESNESLLEAYGIITPGQQIDQLRPKQCPNCSEPNKIDSRFCSKCRTVLTYDSYNEVMEEQKKKESEVQTLKERYEQDMSSMQDKMNRIIEMIQQNPKLAQVKPEALTKNVQ